MIRRQNRMKTSQIDAAMDILRSKGRYGDTELAHVNPREKAILKAMGGAGSRNPRTGLREYYDEGGGMSPEGAGAPSATETGNVSLGEGTNVGAEGLGPSQSIGGESGGSLSDALGRGGMFTRQAMEENRTFTPTFLDVLSPTSTIARGAAFGLGSLAKGLTTGDFSLGPEDVADPLNDLQAFEGGPGGMPGNRSGGGDSIAAALGSVPVSAPTPRYLRGGEMAAPQEISSFIGPGMTDLQQRALISTYGTQGVNSAFRTDPVRRYYANLLSRGLISDRGTPVQNPYVLPIEQQYASMVLGRPMTNPSDAAAAYESIRGLL